MGFGDDQESAMEDYKAASTIMRFNNSFMKSNGYTKKIWDSFQALMRHEFTLK